MGRACAVIATALTIRALRRQPTATSSCLRTSRVLENVAGRVWHMVKAAGSRPVQRTGSVIPHAVLGGLHHCYVRV
jgi:hypothetical protein